MPNDSLRARIPRIATRLLLAAALLAGTAQAMATTFYVRSDGGDATQCTGRGNAPYPGTGSNLACAWRGPHYALPASGAARIAGGDTLYIAPGSYMIGWGAPGAAGGRCYSGGPYDCYLAPIPSGPSAALKTRIIGGSPTSRGRGAGNAACIGRARLWGNERVTKVLNIEGSSNVEVACLEITDQSDCVEMHGNAAARCQRDNAPYGAWASVGLSARASSNVWLHDIDIHGLANRGVLAGGLRDWTLERVRINANGWAGWDGDIGTGSSNAGTILMRNVEIAWNGCGERWRSGEKWACWAQQGGGYGDGIGTASTGGAWIIEDSSVHHNTSDGIDLLYLDGAAGTSATLRRVYAAGNAGNQVKTRGNALLENSVVVGNCGYFNGRYDMVAGDSCRAQGNAVSATLAANQLVTLRHNTITGQGDCLILTDGGNASSTVTISNNVLVGAPEFGAGGELSCGHYANNSSAVVAFRGNLFYGVKSGQCPAGSVCAQSPMLANQALAAFDPDPLPGSPVIDRAALPDVVRGDFYNRARSSGNGPDIGAVEVVAPGGALQPARN